MMHDDPMAHEPDGEDAGVAEYLARFDAVEDAIEGADVIRLMDDATRQAVIAACGA